MSEKEGTRVSPMIVLGLLCAVALVGFTLNYAQESVNALIGTHENELRSRDEAVAQNVLAMLEQIRLLQAGDAEAAIASIEDRLHWELRRLQSWKREGAELSPELSEAIRRGATYEVSAPWSPEGHGHEVTSLRFFAAARPQYVNGKVIGVKVDQVLAGSWLARLGVEDGDVIVQIDGAPIRSLEFADEVTFELSGKNSVAIGFLKPDGSMRHAEYAPN